MNASILKFNIGEKMKKKLSCKTEHLIDETH